MGIKRGISGAGASRAVLQRKRFSNGNYEIKCSAPMRVVEILHFCKLQNEVVCRAVSNHQSLLRAAMIQLNLSARAYHRILLLARAIAIPLRSEETQSAHLAVALQ